MIIKKYALTLLLCFSAVFPAFCNVNHYDDTNELGDFYSDIEIVSIATGTKKKINQAPSVTTVISAQQIKEMGANTIHQVLQSVTGIHVYPSNFNRMNPSYSIRGLHTSQNPQVLVLVNGNKTRSNWTGAKWDLFNTGVGIIERIEIIKGPGSAVHGADAFSGVINIVTKGYESESDNDVGVKRGSFGTSDIWTNLSTTVDGIRIYLNAQRYSTDGDDSRIVDQDVLHAMGLASISNAPLALDTGLRTTDLHLGFESEHFFGNVWYLNNKGGNGSGVAQALSTNDYTDAKSITGQLGFREKLGNATEIEGFVSYQNLEQVSLFTIFPAGMALPRAFDAETGAPSAFTVFTDGVIGVPTLLDDNYNAELVVNYSGLENHKIRASVGYLQSNMDAEEWKNFGPVAQDFTEDFRNGELTDVSGTPFVFSPNQNRDVYYASIQDEWRLSKDWELTAGIRYDNYSDFGSTVNPRAALVWQAKHNLTLKALYGEAFRAPSIGELYAINNPVIMGNADLDAEKVQTFELAMDYRPTFDWKVTFNIFKYQADNLIVYIPQASGGSQANNAAKQDGIGFELETEWAVTENFDIKFGLAIQDSEDAITGESIADAPQKMFDFTLNWQLLATLKLHFDTQFTQDRARLVSDPRAAINDYSWSNANIIYNPTKNLTLSLSVRNLFNQSAFEPSDGQIPNDYPLEERGYWISSKYHF